MLPFDYILSNQSNEYEDQDSSFVGKKLKYTELSLEDTVRAVKKDHGSYSHTTTWRNRRPICPYGCDEEGNLMEIIMKDGKALGLYTHSGSVKPFTADLQMSPKPTGRKLQMNADGEYELVPD